jgi:hypothetical protein
MGGLLCQAGDPESAVAGDTERVQRTQPVDPPASLISSLPRWARVVLRVAVAVMWVPFVAVPFVGYAYLGLWGGLAPLAVYALSGLIFVLLARSRRARSWAEVPPGIDPSDPRWRNLMP